MTATTSMAARGIYRIIASIIVQSRRLAGTMRQAAHWSDLMLVLLRSEMDWHCARASCHSAHPLPAPLRLGQRYRPRNPERPATGRPELEPPYLGRGLLARARRAEQAGLGVRPPRRASFPPVRARPTLGALAQ